MTAKGLRARPDLGRKQGSKKEKKRILIVAEGTVTEPQFFEGLSRYLKETGVSVYGVNIYGEGRDPRRVVKKANEKSDHGRLIGKRDGFDEVWCVFDVDNHNDIAEAIVAAKKCRYKTAVSNPCFDVWLLWHYEECERYITGQQLKRILRKYGISKSLPHDFPYSAVHAAAGRVKHRIGDVPHNPGSGIWKLAEGLCRGRPD